MNYRLILTTMLVSVGLWACTPDNEQTIPPQPPVANAGNDYVVIEGNTITLDGSDSSDRDNNISSYLWETVNRVFTVPNNTDPVTSFPAPEVTTSTDYVFRLTVTDEDGQSSTDTITVTVKNRENTLNATIAEGDQTVEENTTVTMTGIATDGDGTIESHQWNQIDCDNPNTVLSDIALTTDDSNPAKVTFTAPEVTSPITFCFRYTATDNENNTASDTNRITITNLNTPPTASASATPSNDVAPGSVIALNGANSSDVDGPIANYKWELIGDPDTVISDGTNANASYTIPSNATNSSITFRLTVTDSHGATDSTNVPVTILADSDLPIARIDNTIFVVDEKTDFVLDGRAVGGTPGYQYSWAQVGGTDASLTNGTTEDATFNGIEVHRDTEYTFELTVTDSANETATAQITILVINILEARNRYQHNNQCYVMYNIGTTRYVQDDGGYKANQDEPQDALIFWTKPSALGHYIIYNQEFELISNTGNAVTGPAFGLTELDSATEETAVFEFIGKDDPDANDYPTTPLFHVEPTKDDITTYREFNENNFISTSFKLTIGTDTLSAATDSALALGDATGTDHDYFNFETIACPDGFEFPEAGSDAEGEPFKGTTENGHVVGHADTHVHISSTNFLGNSQWGNPYDKLGVTHALADCDEFHGPNGEQDTVGQAYGGDFGPHDTTGWPTFPLWPARDKLTHEAIYWGWIERAWKGGLRIIVNDLVDNETLCELQRPSSPDQAQDCNAMNNVGKQAGTMYGLQDYIDAQYGGRGEGFFQIVYTPEEAREVIIDGKIAVVLGIEISNFLDCKVTYNPSRSTQPWQETGAGPAGQDNSWGCSMDPADLGTDRHVDTQLQRLWDLGVRQIVSIHEFDNALGGNGIFNALVLNAGNRENSGGIPAQAALGSTNDPYQPEDANPDNFGGTGEFWTTYDCPQQGDGDFEGWFSGGGKIMKFENGQEQLPFQCGDLQRTGQGGRFGGFLPCYTLEKRQCNARLMTPIGVHVYTKMMEMGFIFDWDHMELAMKTQALQMQEQLDPPYPMVSTHGDFGGITKDQARRLYSNGGHIFPSLGGANDFVKEVKRNKAAYDEADPTHRVSVFGLGYGTDTNGLSEQARSRGHGDNKNGDPLNDRPMVYPYTLYGNHDYFGDMSDPALTNFFAKTDTMIFEVSKTVDPRTGESNEDVTRTNEAGDGTLSAEWNIDQHQSLHYGFLADFVEELNLEAGATSGPAEDYREALSALFNSAEAFLQTWEKTNAASAAMTTAQKNPAFYQDRNNTMGGINVLRRAPISGFDDPADYHFDKWGEESDWVRDDEVGGGQVPPSPDAPGNSGGGLPFP